MTGVALGRPRVHHRLTDSTNERARALAIAGAPHGTLVTAAEQSAGRGRQGRTWAAPPGKALLMSVLLRHLDQGAALLPLTAAVAVCEACEGLAPVNCQIKWPNDIWVKRRKLAGILVEGRPQAGWAVLGIGLNVATEADEFPEALGDIATSLAIAANGSALSPDEVLDALLEVLDRRLTDPGDQVLDAWRERDALRGDQVRWEGGEGTVCGIGDNGALIVETGDGRIELDAGEVHLRG